MSYELETAILDDGLRNVHFFEGRLLTARDLRDEQKANRDHRQRLAKALGAGVARGLSVRIADELAAKPAEVVVSEGIGITPGGDVLELKSDVHVVLERATEDGEVASLFKECNPAGEQPDATGYGVYLLVVSPAAGYDEFALKSGLGDGGKGKGCGRRYAVEGVRFRLELVLGLNASSGSSVAAEAAGLVGSEAAKSVSKLRNLLARYFVGSEDLEAFLRDPIVGDLSSYGPIDAMRSELGRLFDCDLPLAVMHWTPHGLSFVDDWSVQRRPHQTGRVGWSALVSARAQAEGEAGYRQFLEHAAALAARSDAATLQARDYLRFLPAAGVVPIRADTQPAGFDVASFFNGLSVRGPKIVPGAAVADLIESSFRYPPIDLEEPETIRLYHLEENQPASGVTSPPTGTYVVFASRHLPQVEESTEGPPEIVRLEPAGSFTVGDTLRIVGKGFGDPAENIVTFDYKGEQKTLQTYETGSHEELLILQVPLLTTLPDTGTDVVTLSVHNPRGADSTLVLIEKAKAVVVDGNVLVAQPTTASPDLDVGVHEFTFAVTALTNLEETYDLGVGIVPSGTTAGSWGARAVDQNGNSISSVVIPAGALPAGTTVSVTVEVTIPDGAGDETADLTLSVTSETNATITDTSAAYTFTVGQPPPGAGTVTLTASSISGDLDDSQFPKILVGTGGGSIEFLMVAPSGEEGAYTVTADLPADPWTVTVTDAEVDTGSNLTTFVSIGVATLSTATEETLRVRVEKKTSPSVFGVVDQLVGLKPSS